MWFSVGGGVTGSNASQPDENRGSTGEEKGNIKDRQGGEHIPHSSDVAVQSLKS